MANGFYHESIADAELERQLCDAILIIGSMQSDFRYVVYIHILVSTLLTSGGLAIAF